MYWTTELTFAWRGVTLSGSTPAVGAQADTMDAPTDLVTIPSAPKPSAPTLMRARFLKGEHPNFKGHTCRNFPPPPRVPKCQNKTVTVKQYWRCPKASSVRMESQVE